jgi:hypothetical protein
MNRRHRLATGLVGSVSLIVAVGVGYAIRARADGIPSTGALAYSGVVEDQNGPVNGMHGLQVTLYNTQNGATTCQSTSASFTLVDGHFSVGLPDTCATLIANSPGAWVDVAVDGTSTGQTPIHAVPYAVEASHATLATNATTAASATAAASGGALAGQITGITTNVTALQNAYGAQQGALTTAQNTATSAQNGVNALNGNFDVQASATVGPRLWTQSHGDGISFDWEAGAQFSVWVDGAKQMSWTSNGNSGTKTFVIDHPTDPDRYLVHATLEGPENAVYYRGSAHLHHGVAEVSLPSYFEAATVSAGRTVLATPTFDSADEPVSGLAVSHVKNGAFVVRGVDKSNPEQAFDWEVKAVRADSPALVTEPKRADVAVHGDGPYRYLTTRTATSRGVP